MTDPAAFVLYCFGVSLVICAVAILIGQLPKPRKRKMKPIEPVTPYGHAVWTTWHKPPTTTHTEPKETAT